MMAFGIVVDGEDRFVKSAYLFVQRRTNHFRPYHHLCGELATFRANSLGISHDFEDLMVEIALLETSPYRGGKPLTASPPER
jgi:hypothetical protein